MLYTNYKQVARLILKSKDAIQELGTTHVINTLPNCKSVIKYTFNIQLPYYKFTKNTKLAVESFSFVSEALTYNEVGDIFILNIRKNNIYHSSTRAGTCILSRILSDTTEYINPDVINNSIDITGNTSFLEGNPLEIFVDTKVLDDGFVDIKGCSNKNDWSLTLLIYEEEKEENAKDYVKDGIKNYSNPSLY